MLTGEDYVTAPWTTVMHSANAADCYHTVSHDKGRVGNQHPSEFGARGCLMPDNMLIVKIAGVW